MFRSNNNFLMSSKIVKHQTACIVVPGFGTLKNYTIYVVVRGVKLSVEKAQINSVAFFS